MGYHLPDITLTKDWQDVVELYPEVQNTKITLQGKYVTEAYVFAGTNYDPEYEGTEGSLLLTGMAITLVASRWLVKGKGTISILVEE